MSNCGIGPILYSSGPHPPLDIWILAFGILEYVAPLRERLTQDLHIVVDDVEQLPFDAPLFGLLQALVTAGPLGARWMLLARRMPPVAVESLNIKQQVLRIGNDQLAFTPEETRLFFQRDPHTDFSDDQFNRIQEACEGWIGGMVLLNQALEQMDLPDRKAYLAQLSDRDIARHSGRCFDEVLLAALPEAHRQLVIHSIRAQPHPHLRAPIALWEYGGRPGVGLPGRPPGRYQGVAGRPAVLPYYGFTWAPPTPFGAGSVRDRSPPAKTPSNGRPPPGSNSN